MKSIRSSLAQLRWRLEAVRQRFGYVDRIRWNGARLRRLRRAAELTQREVGELIGTGQAHVARWELGQAPGASNLRRLARVVGREPGDLLR